MARPTIPTPNSGETILTSWGAAVAAAMNGITAGTVNVVLSNVNSATAAVTFPVAYKVAPLVVGTPLIASASGWIATIDAVTATGFTARISARDTGNFSATVPFSWVAIGEM